MSEVGKTNINTATKPVNPDSVNEKTSDKESASSSVLSKYDTNQNGKTMFFNKEGSRAHVVKSDEYHTEFSNGGKIEKT